ncbi:abrin-a [Beta vulgaris subsp. vulgaris]|uniref:abrin-a n=1 Tax=Beta vulgaris subsp. vulgaris TaxID=3555 RepID=UPI0025484413|nr:abrin-a [Beta vulgaris subsp. vulgaris]
MRGMGISLATWTCLLVLLVEPQHYMGSHLPTKEENSDVNVFKIKFTTKKATRNSYMMFIKDLYNALTERGDRNGDIPILPLPLTPSNPQQYLHVELSNGENSITLAINISNVYVLGFQAGETAYFFNDINSAIYDIVFPDSTRRERLPFRGNYMEMQNAAKTHRENIPLGIGVLGQFIENLYHVQPGQNSIIAKALIIMIQMVSEAVRFRNIERKVVATIDDSDGSETYYEEFFPDGLMMEYETSWDPLSTAVQSATDGIFSTEVRLVYGQGEVQVVQTVRQILFFLAIMPLVCKRKSETMVVSQQYYSIIRIPLPHYNQHQQQPDYSFSSLQEARGYNDGDTCDQVLEPKVHITGPDGLCVAVNNGDYHDGNMIVLNECKDDQENQLWTLRTWDQTIRSNGKCLTTYGYKKGAYVMIYDCELAAPDAAKWQIMSNLGRIKNPKSELHLTASKDAATGIVKVIVDHYQYASRQVWLPTNITKPTVTYIVGNQSLCLTQNGVDTVWMLLCRQRISDERWALYPDGTIRPKENQKLCLKYEDGNLLITLGTCGGWSDERWLFQGDGTILHLATGSVIDVIETPSLYQITATDFVEDRISQIWFLFFFFFFYSKEAKPKEENKQEKERTNKVRTNQQKLKQLLRN